MSVKLYEYHCSNGRSGCCPPQRYPKWFGLIVALHVIDAVTHLFVAQACSTVEPDAAKFTSIVVLGYSCNHATATPSLPLQHRLTYAASVASSVGAEVLVCSGGIDAEHDQTLPSEAEIMAGWLLDHIETTADARPALGQSSDSHESAPTTFVIEVSESDTSRIEPTFDRAEDSTPLKILTERRSTSTRENALYSMTVLAEHVRHRCAQQWTCRLRF